MFSVGGLHIFMNIKIVADNCRNFEKNWFSAALHNIQATCGLLGRVIFLYQKLDFKSNIQVAFSLVYLAFFLFFEKMHCIASPELWFGHFFRRSRVNASFVFFLMSQVSPVIFWVTCPHDLQTSVKSLLALSFLSWNINFLSSQKNAV